MTKQYDYDAFISYRHTELDKYAAQLLHKRMEAFRLPGNLAGQQGDGRTRITRVFRDKDELPLTNNLEEPIMQALSSSEFLIVICSPRIRESLWCRKEIETFISMHGREKILAVLIEGEPHESFPEELLYREEKVTDADGTVRTKRVPVEPLAADIRGKNKRAMKKALKTEILRLLAPMFSLKYDDLRQRHRERRMKRILAASLGAGSVCLVFGLVSTAMALRIQSQKGQIEAQTAEILQQNEAIWQQNQTLLLHQAEGLAQEARRLLDAGDRQGALETAYRALTSSDGNPMPYTPEAQFILTESLAVYDDGNTAKPLHQMETMGIIEQMKLTEDRNTLVTYDNSGCLTVWDVASGDKLWETRDLYTYVDENSFAPLGSDRLACINGEARLVIYDIRTGQMIQETDYQSYSSVYADPAGKHLVLVNYAGMRIVDGETLETAQVYDELTYSLSRFSISNDGVRLAFQSKDQEKQNSVQIWNLETGEKYPALNIGTSELKKILFKDGVGYALLNDHDSSYTDFETTVRAFEPETGRVLWNHTEGTFGNDLLLPYAEGASRMLVVGTFEAFLLEMEDGSQAAAMPYGTNVAGTAVFLELDTYLVFTRSGEYHVVLADTPQDVYVSGTFRSHSQNVKEFMVAADGFLVLPYQDNKVTYYTFSQGQDIAPYDGEVPEAEAESCDDAQMQEAVQEAGLVKAALVSSVFYDRDKSKMFVYYTDDTLEIYNTADGSLLNTLTVESVLNRYIGTDKEGNIYIGGYGSGYMLNPECRPLATVEGLVGVDAENGRLFLKKKTDEFYTVPIYSLEELLAKAKADVL